MFCCACNGSCMHVGPHSYCDAHAPNRYVAPVPTVAPNAIPVVVPSTGSGADMNLRGMLEMQQRPLDRLARELAMAVVEWLASDGDDDKFAVVAAKAAQWREAVVDA